MTNSPLFAHPHKSFRIQKAYEKQFNAFKPAKRVRWMTSLGSLSLEIELADRTLNVDVSPLDAAIIELVGESPSDGKSPS